MASLSAEIYVVRSQSICGSRLCCCPLPKYIRATSREYGARALANDKAASTLSFPSSLAFQDEFRIEYTLSSKPCNDGSLILASITAADLHALRRVWTLPM